MKNSSMPSSIYISFVDLPAPLGFRYIGHRFGSLLKVGLREVGRHTSWGHQYSAFGLRVADGLNSHSLPIEICVKPLSCGIKPMGALAQSAAECRR